LASTPTWLAPVNLSAPGQDASRPNVTFDQQGNATAVWERFNGSNWIIESAKRPAGGAWSEPVALSIGGQDAEFPQVGVDQQGRATAVWERFNGMNWIIQSAERPAGGAFWSAPVNLSIAGNDARISKLTVDSQGDATAVWRRVDDSNNWIIQSAERLAGGAWSGRVNLSIAGQDAKFPELAADAQNDATAVWERFNGSNWIIQSAERPAGGAWSEPVDLSAAGQNGGSPQVAVDPNGNATAVWQRSGSTSVIQSAMRPMGGVWSKATDISTVSQSASGPEVAVDPDGNATAVWRRFNGNNWIIQSAERPAGGAWSEPVDLSAAGQNAEWPNVTVDQQDDVTAVWRRFNGSNWIIQSAERPAGGAWSEPVDLSAAGQDAGIPQIAVNTGGKAMAIWPRFNGSNWIIQSAERGAQALGNPPTAPLSSTAPPGSVNSLHGITVLAPHILRVVRNSVLLRLQCRGSDRCTGVVKLMTWLREPRTSKRHEHGRRALYARRVLVGKAQFNIPAGRSKMIRVNLNDEGETLLRHARHHRLNVELQGRDVNRNWLMLKRGGN
jgi:hypothetical protein